MLHRHKLLLLQRGPYYGPLLELHAFTLAACPYLLSILAMFVCLLGAAELPDASGSSPAAKKRRVDASSSKTGNTVRVPCLLNHKWIHDSLMLNGAKKMSPISFQMYYE